MATAVGVSGNAHPACGSDGSAHGIRLSAGGAVEEKGRSPVARTVRKAQHNTEIPALRILLEVHAGTRAKPLKGGRRIMPVAKEFFSTHGSRLPMMNPITMGMMLAMISVMGKLPMPEAPNAIMVKGPVIEGKDRDWLPHLFHHQIRLPGLA